MEICMKLRRVRSIGSAITVHAPRCSLKIEFAFKENNFKLLKNLSSYLNYHFRVLRSNVKLNLNNEYKVKTSIQGNFTYTPSSNLDKRFWKKRIGGF